MAFIINKMSEYGVNATYHKLDFIHIDNSNRSFTCSIKSYLSLAAKTANRTPLFTSDYYVTYDALGFDYTQNIFNLLYIYLKTLPEWATATEG
jgi:hypothetical protein